jgi:hypothetical protein
MGLRYFIYTNSFIQLEVLKINKIVLNKEFDIRVNFKEKDFK